MGGTFGNDGVETQYSRDAQCSRDASIASLRYKKYKKQGGWVSIIYTTHPPLFLHFLYFYFKRSAFKTTKIELNDMPMAAIHGSTQPIAAIGMATTL